MSFITTKFHQILLSGFEGVALTRKTGLTDSLTNGGVKNIIPFATRCVGYNIAHLLLLYVKFNNFFFASLSFKLSYFWILGRRRGWHLGCWTISLFPQMRKARKPCDESCRTFCCNVRVKVYLFTFHSLHVLHILGFETMIKAVSF